MSGLQKMQSMGNIWGGWEEDGKQLTHFHTHTTQVPTVSFTEVTSQEVNFTKCLDSCLLPSSVVEGISDFCEETLSRLYKLINTQTCTYPANLTPIATCRDAIYSHHSQTTLIDTTHIGQNSMQKGDM